MPAKKDHPAPYYVSRALGNYIKVRRNWWREIGLSPDEPGAIADQLMTNGHHYAFGASDVSNRLLNGNDVFSDDADGKKSNNAKPKDRLDELQRRRVLYLANYGDLYRIDPKASRAPKAGARDTRGRVVWSGRVPLSERFYNGWIFPPTDKGIEKTLVDRIERLGKDSQEGPEGDDLRDIRRDLELRLDELRFYRRLKNGEVPSARYHFGGQSPEGYLRDCYRVLLPIWVCVQRRNAGAGDIALNLYNTEFWSYSPEDDLSDEDSKLLFQRAPVLDLIDDLCEHFGRDVMLSGSGIVKDFREQASELFDCCRWDEQDISGPSGEGLGDWGESACSVEELFEQSLRGELDLPSWATDRANFIGLIMVGSFVGVQAALDFVDKSERKRCTSDELQEDEAVRGADELCRGSGIVPLIVKGGTAWNLDLGEKAPAPGVLCVFGNRYSSDFWGVVWRRRVKELLWERLFSPRAYLDVKSPDSLISRLCERIERFNWEHGLSKLEEVGSGAVVDRLREELDASLSACFEVSFGTQEQLGEDPYFDLGTRDRCTEGTIFGALRDVADNLNTWICRAWRRDRDKRCDDEAARIELGGLSLEDREAWLRQVADRRKTKPPSVKEELQRSLWATAQQFFERQCSFDATPDAPTLIGRALADIEQAYAKENAYDPSMCILVTRLRKRLGELLWKKDARSPRSKAIRCSVVLRVVDEVVEETDKMERERFVPFESSDVSRRHAVLYLDEEGKLKLADAGSLHGTALMRDGTGGAFVLEGSSRTRLSKIESARWMTHDPQLLQTAMVCKGDVIRLAGDARAQVGSSNI